MQGHTPFKHICCQMLQASPSVFHVSRGFLRWQKRERLGSSLQYFQCVVKYFQIDSWIDFSATLLIDSKKFDSALTHLDKQLSPVTYLVGQSITLADFAVWGALKGMVFTADYAVVWLQLHLSLMWEVCFQFEQTLKPALVSSCIIVTLNQYMWCFLLLFICFMDLYYWIYYILLVNDKLDHLLNNGQAKNVSRWFNFLANQSSFKQCSGKVAPSKKSQVWEIKLYSHTLLGPTTASAALYVT